MLLRQLKYFVAVADTGSFTEAAERCYISQSAISQQIQALERELGVKLLDRSTRRPALTPAGDYLYREGQSLLERAAKLKRETIRLGQDRELSLRIGYIEGYEGEKLQEAIYEFTELYPDVVLTVTKHSHEDLFQRISADEVDLVLSYQRRAFSDAYVNHHLRYIPCLVEMSSRSPFSEQEVVYAEDVMDIPCILVAKREQQPLEQNFYRNVLGVGNQFFFVESMDDARLNVVGNRGIFPVADLGSPGLLNPSIRRLPLRHKDGKPIHFNYCAFWKKARSNYYIEEFVDIFQRKFVQEEETQRKDRS